MGCCWGNVRLLMSFEESGTGNAGKKTIKDFTGNAQKCGVTLQSKPCKSGLKMKGVKSKMKLSGITASQFSTTAQRSYQKGIATALEVEEGTVQVVDFKDVAA